MPTEAFRREVEKELTGREEEPSELIYFKLYKSQIPVIEQAIETAALMLGADKSRLLSGDDLRGLSGRGQPGPRRSGHTAVFDDEVFQVSARGTTAGISGRLDREGILALAPRLSPLAGGSGVGTNGCGSRSCVVTGWRCQWCGTMSNLEVHQP
jgi:hypothetical protein